MRALRSKMPASLRGLAGNEPNNLSAIAHELTQLEVGELSLDERLTSFSASVPAQMDIRLNGSITSGVILGRYDITVTGQVIADQPVEKVSLVVDDETRAFCLYGKDAGDRQLFVLTLAQRKGAEADLTSFDIVARTKAGHEQRTAFRIFNEPENPRAARLVDGPILDLSLGKGALTPIMLYVERAAIDLNGALHVEGWCVALTQIVAVQVLVGGHRRVVRQFSQIRGDIAAAFAAYPNAGSSGFIFAEALPGIGEMASVTVEAIDLKGSAIHVVIPVEAGVVLPEYPTPTFAIPPTARTELEHDPRRTIFLHSDYCDLSIDGELRGSGWAVCATAIAGVSVYLDGESMGDAQVGLRRLDVVEEYQGIPQAAYSGFEYKQRCKGRLTGEHQVVVRARNGLGDAQDLLLTVIASEPVAPKSHRSSAAQAGGNQFMFVLDRPLVIDGSVPSPVVGRFVVEGWAMARSGIDTIDILLDDVLLGQAYYGTTRRDVEAAFPGWANAFRSGYIFHCPPRALESGLHIVRMQLKSKDGDKFDSEFQIDVQKSQDNEDYATIRRHIPHTESIIYHDILARLKCRPSFRLFVASPGVIPRDMLNATLRSLSSQVYRDWQLIVVTDGDESTDWLEAATRERVQDQVTVISSETAGHSPSVLTALDDRCLIGVLCPGDQLGCDALAEIAVARGLYPEVEFFYADEERVSPSSRVREPFFKPAWSPDLLLSTNYIGRPWWVTANLIATAGVTPQSLLEQHGDYDAVLRCTELTSRIHHLPVLLLRRDDTNEIDPSDERRVLASAAIRRGIKAKLLPGCVPGTWRLKRTIPAKGMVSIIIPTCAAKGYVGKCLETLRAKTAYRNFEIICIDNIPPELPEWKDLVRRGADKVVEIREPFNWSRFNNRAAALAKGKYLLFLNDDVEVEQEDWLDAMLEHAQRPEVGIVGPQLLYPNRKVQHAGIFLTTLGAGRHSFRFLSEDDPGYFGLALTQRNVMAVTGACMLMRREVFEHIGRFDEAHDVVNNDVDCCLRSWKAGLSIVYTPHSRLIHHELASRANMKDDFDSDHFAKQWQTLYAAGDPFFSPRLTKFSDEYSPDTEPVRVVCASRPLFEKDAIRRILAVKLDHIGDLITALPALCRLRHHFPAARIYLLASGAARAFLGNEELVDELIEFEFFHARSGLGQKDVTEENLLALGERLVHHCFDLAIDLRKQVETRHILKYLPARFKAGYNHLGQFPWLDVALEWEGDNQLRRKQSHISDDLVRLVDAVATAAEATGHGAQSRAANAHDDPLPPGLSVAARALFRKPVVAVHPGVGAIMRQWLPRYFATVIDLLVEKDRVNVVLVGGHDEAKLAKEVLGYVANRRNVVSLAGRTSLDELKKLLSACSLYVGNNSGPQHIAAALGVPTVGIYSGVVDAAEWGPTGARAVALQRNMICSPCYLVKPDECVRDMACLKRLEPAVVHRYCEMMLAQAVPTAGADRTVRRKAQRASSVKLLPRAV